MRGISEALKNIFLSVFNLKLVLEQVHHALVSVLDCLPALSLSFASVRCPLLLSAVVLSLPAAVNCSLKLFNLVLCHLTFVRRCPPPSAAVRRHCFVRRPLDLVRLFARRPTPPVPESDSPPRSTTRRFFVRYEQARTVHAPPSARRKVTVTPP
ncbi:hypothetical protein LR48_Vigan03g170600 [Vigna angularis]|uniref:Uncharacterized protein n=1 Tax=Phaseolus angularis TaxID=3914 RepID=A0A0L9U7A2_PHAAN|nr:hypothetical protein LR48_Vigan03g170600 [Vigna angularis]